MMIGTLWLHWLSGTLFRLTERNRDGLLCGIEDGTRAFVMWPAAECSEVAG
jgi:hypothetical protein